MAMSFPVLRHHHRSPLQPHSSPCRRFQPRRTIPFYPSNKLSSHPGCSVVPKALDLRALCHNLPLEEPGMASIQKTTWMPILEKGVFRFDHAVNARENASPSLSFLDPAKRETPLEDRRDERTFPSYFPQWAVHGDRQIASLLVPVGSSVYGTGEVSGPLERTGQRIFTWNSDAWGYGKSTTSLYQSHPWVLVVLPDGEVLGVLADTTSRCEIDLRNEGVIQFVASVTFPVITFGPFMSPNVVLRSLSKAIGTINMPPKWSLGYHQCRWSYEPDSRVLQIARTFREKQIPCDVLWMDIDYMDGFKCFTFDPNKFSSPKVLAESLHQEGFKAVWMLDPGIKAETGYFVYDIGCLKDVWTQSSKGEPYLGEVWPGPCVFPDFSSSITRDWWANLVKDFVSNGVDGIWNDMNEPTVFKTVSKTMPASNIHRGDLELGGTQNHSYYHNVYGMLMARSTNKGMLLGNPKKRPFVLTRAGFIGSQRYAATWTGDNLSTWDHLRMSIPMSLNLSLSGQPFSGPDIGGFAGDATPRLFARWMGIGTLLPFCRGHSEKGTVDHEPWSFGIECETVCRHAIQRRYQLLPHIYTLFYNAHVTGEPVISPLFFADTMDKSLRNVEDSFLLGPILASVSTEKGGASTKDIVFPKGIWQEFHFDDTHEDLPVLFLKGGSIIPTGPIIQSTVEMHRSNDLTLVVALDEHGNAKGTLYEDDGDGFDYQNGSYLLTSYAAMLQGKDFQLWVASSNGLLERPNRVLNVHLLVGGGAKVVFSGIDGEVIKFKLPDDSEIAQLIAESKKKRIVEEEALQDEIEVHDPLKGVGVPRVVMDLNAGDWKLKVVPWIGGRIISMVHNPSDIEWLWSRLESSGYEEYSGVEYRSPGCTEEYDIIKQDIPQIGGSEKLLLEGDIGGGLAMQRTISILDQSPELLQIESTISAKSDLAGSGGFSRVVCLRVHPTFQLRHPMDTFITFTSVKGGNQCISTECDEVTLQGDDRPNGKWMLVDKCANVALVNKFVLEEVEQCLICWGPGTCNLELWSPQRPVSKTSSISIHHSYETIFNEGI